MKTLEELGVSPAPWHAGNYDDIEETNEVYCPSELRLGCNKTVCSTNIDFKNADADARLIAAAPVMYKTECNLVDVIERLMNGWAGTCDTPPQDEVVAALEAAKNALAKAAREEARNGND